MIKPGIVVQASNPRTQKTEAGSSLLIPGQPGVWRTVRDTKRDSILEKQNKDMLFSYSYNKNL